MMMKQIKLMTVLVVLSFVSGAMLSAYYDDGPPPPAPEVVAVPVYEVVTMELPEVYPWKNVDGALIDCNKERNSERIALACNIYHEARSETLEGQVAVGLVTRNRVLSEKYPDTYSEVVWDIRRSARTKRKVAQFSWALDGKHDRVYDRQEWRTAWEIAGDIITNEYHDVTEGALWYHTKAVKPVWRNSFEVSTVIGEHIFYVQR